MPPALRSPPCRRSLAVSTAPAFPSRRAFDNPDGPVAPGADPLARTRPVGRRAAARANPVDPTNPGRSSTMSSGSDLIALIASRQDVADYQKTHWNGTFSDYLEIVREHPRVA